VTAKTYNKVRSIMNYLDGNSLVTLLGACKNKTNANQ